MNLHAIAEKQKSVKNLHARMSHENLHARLSNELTLTFGHMTQNLEGGHGGADKALTKSERIYCYL